MSKCTSRMAKTAGHPLCVWAMTVLLVAGLCCAPLWAAESPKGEAAQPEISGPAITKAPLQEAAGDGDLDQVKELLSKGTDVNGRDVLGTTPLMFAANGGNLEVCTLLIEKKADVNAKNKDGVTALMFASAAGDLPVVKLLLEKGANINTPDKDGKNALSYAKADGRQHVEQFLASKGAKEPPDMETMGWRHHRRCYRVPVCVRWHHGHCREWAYEVKCRRRHHHRHWD